MLQLQKKLAFTRVHTMPVIRGFGRTTRYSKNIDMAGFPDLLIDLPAGRHLYIELKAAGGRLRPDQRVFRDMRVALGHAYHVVTTVEQFEAILQENGIQLNTLF
jgi:hypothetical protein